MYVHFLAINILAEGKMLMHLKHKMEKNGGYYCYRAVFVDLNENECNRNTASGFYIFILNAVYASALHSHGIYIHMQMLF